MSRRPAPRAAALVAVLAAGLALILGGCSSGAEGAAPPAATPSPAPPPADASADLARFYTQPVDWANCGGGFQCATVEVPLDYADPAGPTIALAINRLPAAGPGERLGSLLVNPGGPGASGLDYARTAEDAVSERVRARYDVVGLDPRGVGESTPVDCVDDAELDALLTEDSTPDTPDEVAELERSGVDYAAACVDRSGDLLGHVGTAEVARDVDVLRSVLGDERLVFLGKSYGTEIGAVYAGLLPERVGRLVLDGVVDRTVPQVERALAQAVGFEEALQQFAGWCVDEPDCTIGDDEQQVLDAVDGLLRSTDANPLPTSSDRLLTESLAFYGAILPLYLPAADGFPLLAQAVADGIDGDGTLLLAFADAYLQRGEDGRYAGNLMEAFGAVRCLDDPHRLTLEEAAGHVAEFEEEAPVFGRSAAWSLAGCDGWPVQATGSTDPIRAAGAAPVLVVGTTGDTATPYSAAVSLAEQLDSAVLLTWRGTGHTAYRQGSPCIDEAVDAYLLDGTVPAENTTCD